MVHVLDFGFKTANIVRTYKLLKCSLTFAPALAERAFLSVKAAILHENQAVYQ